MTMPASIGFPHMPDISTSTFKEVVIDPTMSTNINEIATALSNAQGDLESAKKGSEGYGYNYSDLASVIAAAKPILKKHGLAITQLLGSDVEGKPQVTTILTHTSGQFFKSVLAMESIVMKGCNSLQSAGASFSYLRRYAYQAILGMASEDNDASSDGKAVPKAAAKGPQKFRRTKKVEDKPAVEEEDDGGL